jgi:TonB family protein
MTIAWMVYCLLISLLLGFAALAAERALRLCRRPIRWFWSGAMVGSLALPGLAYLFPLARPVVREPLLPVIEAIVGVEGISAAASLEAGGPPVLIASIDDLLLAFWALASALVLVFLTRSYFRLRMERRRWSPGTVGESDVFVSRRLGPAVTGLFRSRIVIPAWALELDDELRRMILLHEEEHLRAGDHRLLLCALAALTIMPWNLPLWWQFRRLRLALELDCDGRVLSQGVSPRAYGQLLLEVGRRSASPSFLPAAFSEPRSFLEERVRNMIAKVPTGRPRKTAVAAVLAVALLAVALTAPGPAPSANADSSSGLDEPTRPDAAVPQDTTRPHFTPYTVRPEIKDRREAIATVERHYPDSLKAAGIGGTAIVWVLIDEEGAVARVELQKSSGIDVLDTAALTATLEFEFTPALNANEVVPVWVAVPITFSSVAGGPSASTLAQLKATLRLVATFQEKRYEETGEYYKSYDALLERANRDLQESGTPAIPRAGVEVTFEAGERGWAAVAQKDGLECAMYYGDVAAPRDYAEHGKAVCK